MFTNLKWAHRPLEPMRENHVFPECVAKGSRLTLGGLGVEPCSRSVVSTSATVRNRPQHAAQEAKCVSLHRRSVL